MIDMEKKPQEPVVNVEIVDLEDEQEPEEEPQPGTEDEDSEKVPARASFSYSSPTISFSVDSVGKTSAEALELHVLLRKLWEDIISKKEED